MIPVDYEGLFALTTQKIFDDIFNYTDITLKNNVKLTILNGGVAVRSMIYTGLIAAMMPDTTHSYYIFMCDNTALSNLLGSTKSWVNLEDVLNETKVNVDFITLDNRMLPKRLVYGYVDSTGVTVIAIDAKAYSKLGTVKETYLTINIDTDLVGERTVVSHLPGYNNNISTILAKLNTTEEKHRIGCINGYIYRNDLFGTTGDPASDFYELYVDENIQHVFTVDLATRNTYMSSEEDLYKDIVIIPKDLINNKVCTYDTITVVVRTYDGKGVLLPFFAAQSVSQLTHACFSISSVLIDAALDKLGVTSGELYVIISNYSKTNVHVANGSITEQLYTLDDTTIKEIMLNDVDHRVNYWKADQLEQRMYGKFLTDMDVLDNYDPALINNQIEALGYYSFVNTLCKHNGDIKDLGSELNNLSIAKPAFWEGTALFPVLFLDGNKIARDRYTITQTDTAVDVVFDIPIPVDFTYSILQYELMLAPTEEIYICTVDAAHLGISIPKINKVLHVYRKTATLLKSIDQSEHTGYVESFLENNLYYNVIEDQDAYHFVFKDYAQSHSFVFMYENLVVINNHPNLDISSGRTLSFIPQGGVVETTDQVSILLDGEYEVFLNGRLMIPGVDFCITSLVDDDVVGGTAITIQNLKFLRDTNINDVDIHKTNRKILSSDVGYVVDGIIPRNENNEAWFDGISRLFINGKRVPFECVVQKATHYEIDSKYWSNGYVYYFVNSVSHDFYDAYLPYIDPAYFPGRKEVSNYFTRNYQYQYPDPIIITYPNRIFSSYLNEIIRRILDDTILVNNINDDNDIINQLINYEPLKQFDVIFGDNKIDKRFIDIYPGYLATTAVSDFNKYLYIQRLVKILLGTDTITDHTVIYTGS